MFPGATVGFRNIDALKTERRGLSGMSSNGSSCAPARSETASGDATGPNACAACAQCAKAQSLMRPGGHFQRTTLYFQRTTPQTYDTRVQTGGQSTD